jgi:hypothetical protein
MSLKQVMVREDGATFPWRKNKVLKPGRRVAWLDTATGQIVDGAGPAAAPAAVAAPVAVDDFEALEDKDALIEFALRKYNYGLPRSASVKNMKQQIREVAAESAAKGMA